MENRNGLLIDLMVSQATGSAERNYAKDMMERERRKGVKGRKPGSGQGV